MRSLIHLVILVFFLGTVSSTTLAQEKPSEFTPSETREIRAFAKRFERRLLQTKDIRPLMKEFFVKDFIARGLQNEYFVFSDSSLLRSRRMSDIKRFYIGLTNWMYLLELNGNGGPSDPPSTGDNFNDFLQLLPKCVQPEIKKHKDLWPLLENFPETVRPDDANAKVKMDQYFVELLPLLEKTARLMQRHAIATHPWTTKARQAAIKSAGEYMHAYQPGKYACDNDCYGYPKETRISYVNIPLYQLILTKIDNRFKVLDFEFYVD